MRILEGKVVSAKTPKTIIVEVERKSFHPLYKKIIRRTKRYKVHNENSDIKVGDLVKIQAVRPISKEKHFKVI